jgi:hypothetical protein
MAASFYFFTSNIWRIHFFNFLTSSCVVCLAVFTFFIIGILYMILIISVQWYLSLFFSFCGTGVCFQQTDLQPLHQPFFVMGVFWHRVLQTICPGWLLLCPSPNSKGKEGLGPTLKERGTLAIMTLDATLCPVKVCHLVDTICPILNRISCSFKA